MQNKRLRVSAIGFSSNGIVYVTVMQTTRKKKHVFQADCMKYRGVLDERITKNRSIITETKFHKHGPYGTVFEP